MNEVRDLVAMRMEALTPSDHVIRFELCKCIICGSGSSFQLDDQPGWQEEHEVNEVRDPVAMRMEALKRYTRFCANTENRSD